MLILFFTTFGLELPIKMSKKRKKFKNYEAQVTTTGLTLAIELEYWTNV